MATLCIAKGIGNRQQATGNRQQATGNRQQATKVSREFLAHGLLLNAYSL